MPGFFFLDVGCMAQSSSSRAGVVPPGAHDAAVSPSAEGSARGRNHPSSFLDSSFSSSGTGKNHYFSSSGYWLRGALRMESREGSIYPPPEEVARGKLQCPLEETTEMTRRNISSARKPKSSARTSFHVNLPHWEDQTEPPDYQGRAMESVIKQVKLSLQQAQMAANQATKMQFQAEQTAGFMVSHAAELKNAMLKLEGLDDQMIDMGGGGEAPKAAAAPPSALDSAKKEGMAFLTMAI